MLSPEDYLLIWKALAAFEAFIIFAVVIADYMEEE